MSHPNLEKIEGRRRPDEEALLDQKIRSVLGTGAEEYSAEHWCGLRENARLPLLYEGQFVACRNHYVGEGHARRLIYVEVLCASSTLEDLHDQLSRQPEAEDDPPLHIVPVL